MAESLASRILRRSGPGRRLAPAAHRARELVLAARAEREDRRAEVAPEIERLARGQPIPPASLRVKVQRNASALSFLVNGRNQHAFIAGLLERHGIEPAGGRVLDFGCGCGKNLRWWWPEVDAEFHGCDVNPKLARWVDGNLPHVSAVANGPLPPLPYPSERFDLLYSISIFTHLPEDRQVPWMDEVARVVKPGGVLLLTMAGSAYADELPAGERRRYDAGELIVRFGEQPGSNLCAVYHPPDYVMSGGLIDGLELLEYVPGDPERAKMRQDAYLLRRPEGWLPRGV